MTIPKLKNKIYTKKQMEILSDLVNTDWFICILHGAVRSGKTVLNNDLFLLELLRVKQNAEKDGVRHPMYILGAYNSNTLHTNILIELTNKYGVEFNFDRHGNFELFGVKIITTFTNNISGVGSIRGMTAYGAYINEASQANKFVFDEIISRCSGTGARIICDTNPEYPSHWLKTNYIDKATTEPNIKAFHFTMLDNDFLSERYVNNMIASTPSGALTDRSIYGLWTAGEGAIYKDFDKEKHVITKNQWPKDIRKYIAGVDWGYKHYGTIAVFAIDDNGAYYLLEEHAHQDWHIDQWVEAAKKVAQKYNKEIPFYCDTARSEYIDAFYYAGLNARGANKNVLEGIAEVGQKIKRDLFYCDRSCTHFLQEVDQYVWAEKGDAPEKLHDDMMDAVRYAIYTEELEPETYFS